MMVAIREKDRTTVKAEQSNVYRCVTKKSSSRKRVHALQLGVGEPLKMDVNPRNPVLRLGRC